MMRTAFFALLMTGMAFVAGCNTISGAGQDISNTGGAISGAADSVEEKL